MFTLRVLGLRWSAFSLALGLVCSQATLAAPYHTDYNNGAMLRDAAQAHSKFYIPTKAGSTAACATLAGKAVDRQTRIVTATLVAPTQSVPGFCDVRGVILPRINFEVALPLQWNERLYVFGNGGLAGESLDDPSRIAQRNTALLSGFSVAQTDTGHTGGEFSGADFVDPIDTVDYGYRAIHLTNTAAKAITLRYYRSAARYAYFGGCSDGGREGLFEAEHYPTDFNGIVAGAPFLAAVDTVISGAWASQVLAAAPLSIAKLQTIAAADLAQCDALDGVRDGIISDPRRCDLDVRKLVKQCPPGTDAPDCLTSAQATTFTKLLGGVISRGRPYFPGLPPGVEAYNGFVGFLVPAPVPVAGLPLGITIDYQFQTQFLGDVFSFPFPGDFKNLGVFTFNFDRDPYRLDPARRVLDATSTDLRAFARNGGKMLTYTGWADNIIDAYVSPGYYENLERDIGPRIESTYRLFMLPGVQHCGGGVGADTIDPLTPVIDWVETGVPPDYLVASKLDSTASHVLFTRKACPYPKEAKFIGGNSNIYQDYRCGPGIRGIPVGINNP